MLENTDSILFDHPNRTVSDKIDTILCLLFLHLASKVHTNILAKTQPSESNDHQFGIHAQNHSVDIPHRQIPRSPPLEAPVFSSNLQVTLARTTTLGSSSRGGGSGSGSSRGSRRNARSSTARGSTTGTGTAGEGTARRATGTSGTTAAVSRRSIDTTVGIVVSSGASRAGVVGGGVVTNGDPSQNTLGDVVTEQDVLDKGVVVRGRFAKGDAVTRVESQFLGVGVVRRNGLDFRDESLVEEKLTDVVRHAVNVGVVVQDSGARRRLDVDVGSTAGVVAREHGIELNNSIVIGLLNTAAKGRVQTALAGGRNTRVHAGSIAVPSVDQDLGHTRAGGDVDKLDVEVQRHAGLPVGHLTADQLAGNPVGTNSGLGNDDARGVLGEEGSRIGIKSVSRGRLMVDSCPGGQVTLSTAADRS